MTPREMQRDFEYKVNMYDSELMVMSAVVFHWLNDAQELQVITHYTGNNPYDKSFEEGQKRTDDLQPLVTETEITVDSTSNSIKPNSFTVSLPDDYLFLIGEEAIITYTNNSSESVTKIVEVYPTTNDRYTKELKNPFGVHKLHYGDANPLRLMEGNYFELITDGNYDVTSFILRYIRKPNEIVLDGDDCELPEYMHSHIVDKAVNLYLESIGSNRYSSSKNELSDKE